MVPLSVVRLRLHLHEESGIPGHHLLHPLLLDRRLLVLQYTPSDQRQFQAQKHSKHFQMVLPAAAVQMLHPLFCCVFILLLVCFNYAVDRHQDTRVCREFHKCTFVKLLIRWIALRFQLCVDAIVARKVSPMFRKTSPVASPPKTEHT